MFFLVIDKYWKKWNYSLPIFLSRYKSRELYDYMLRPCSMTCRLWLHFFSINGGFWRWGSLRWQLVKLYPHRTGLPHDRSSNQSFTPDPDPLSSSGSDQHQVGWNQLCSLVPGCQDVHLRPRQARIYQRWLALAFPNRFNVSEMAHGQCQHERLVDQLHGPLIDR